MQKSGEFDFVVVGAGLIGLATARALIRRRPGARLAVLDKERQVASHQSGHNSGVIHSGIYYQPGSLKARLCVEGARLLHSFCNEHAIPHPRCGKLIIAVDATEFDRLDNLKHRGDANGVKGLRILDKDELQQIEPHASGLQALYSPDTAIVDFRTVAQALASEVIAASAQIQAGVRVTGLRRSGGAWTIESKAESIRARTVVTCAGLESDLLARMTGAPREPRIVPFRGQYWRLKPEAAALVKGLIYPVPDPAFPFLGVHYTPRVDGEVWVGPNAILALTREAYRARSVDPRQVLNLLGWPGFYRLMVRYWRMGLRESHLSLSKSAFVSELRRYLPALPDNALERGSAGVRAQAVSRDGRLLDDFVFSEEEGILHVRNAPSPAATACLAIAETIVDRLKP